MNCSIRHSRCSSNNRLKLWISIHFWHILPYQMSLLESSLGCRKSLVIRISECLMRTLVVHSLRRTWSVLRTSISSLKHKKLKYQGSHPVKSMMLSLRCQIVRELLKRIALFESSKMRGSLSASMLKLHSLLLLVSSSTTSWIIRSTYSLSSELNLRA